MNFAKQIGKGLARFQAFADEVLDFGFKKLKSFSKTKTETPETDDLKSSLLKGLKKTAGFFGETGETFFNEYERIKAKRARNKDK